MQANYQPRPAVVPWFKVYSGIMTLLYLGTLVLGVLFLVLEPDELLEDDALTTRIQGVGLVAISVPLAVGFGMGPFLPQRSWAWVYGLVLICIGFTSFCCLPATIPLMIYWIKPETRDYFRSPSPDV